MATHLEIEIVTHIGDGTLRRAIRHETPAFAGNLDINLIERVIANFLFAISALRSMFETASSSLSCASLRGRA
jgi:hypothetical protein